MKTRNRFLVTIVLMVCLLMVGCSNAMTPQEYKQLAASLDSYQAKVDQYQQVTEQMSAILQTTGIVDANLAAKADKIQREIDRVQPQIADITEAIKYHRYSEQAQSDEWLALIETLKVGNRVSSSWNPFSVYIESGLVILSLVLGLFAKKKAAEAKDNAELADVAMDEAQTLEKGLMQTVRGIEEAKSDMPVIELAKLKTRLAKHQDIATKQYVTGMRA